MLSAKKELFTPSGGAYQISRSVRTRSSASGYFNKTLTTPTNNLKWTWSAWIKRGTLSVANVLFGAGDGSSNNFGNLQFTTSNTLQFAQINGGAYNVQMVTSAVFRDPAAWYHIQVVYDSANATSTDRVQIYVNGVRQSVTYSTGPFAQNTASKINSAIAHYISKLDYTTVYFDGYLTDVNFIDGQALTPSSFGETNPITGVWQPKRYTGTYGNNGFYLNFSDNSNNTATTIGKDYSGNGNNWTPNNISVTAGTTYDSMIDVPTLYDDGNTGRGNYCTFNPLAKGTLFPAPTEGNLRVADTTVGNYHQSIGSTIAVNTGKWYWEIPVNGTTFNSRSLGIAFASQLAFSTSNQNAMWNTTTDLKDYRAIFMINSTTMTPCRSIAGTVTTATNITLPSTLTASSVFMVAMDIGAGAIWFGLNGVWLKGATTAEIIAGTTTNAVYTDIASPSDSWTPAVYSYLGAAGYGWFANFGQRPFAYTPPTGFKALNTQNLPDATIKNGATSFAATTYTGDGATTKTIATAVNGVSFQPDFTWVKRRSGASSHVLQDAIRGFVGTAKLASNATDAENNTGGATGSAEGFVSAVSSTGFTVTKGTGEQVNENGATYVGWQWNAGGTTVTNTSGTISAQVRANPTAGFSVVTWTQAAPASTVGHGLGVAPKIIFVKQRAAVNSWYVYSPLLTPVDSALFLNGTNASTNVANIWNNTAATSNVFSLGTPWGAGTMVAYCFAAVAGYSAFGKYTGNGSADGPFVYCGFRPRFIMWKRTDTTGDWVIQDTARGPYNQTPNYLIANTSGAEGSPPLLDINSNGFKVRINDVGTNASGGTYIFAAFAEVPFRYANAR